MENRHNVVKSNEVRGVCVKNSEKVSLGEIEEIMLDKRSGRVAYVVMSFGGFLGMGEKLFALPWTAISYNPNEDCFILNRTKESLKEAPGFDKDHWPDMADTEWGRRVNNFYGTRPYWEE